MAEHRNSDRFLPRIRRLEQAIRELKAQACEKCKYLFYAERNKRMASQPLPAESGFNSWRQVAFYLLDYLTVVAIVRGFTIMANRITIPLPESSSVISLRVIGRGGPAIADWEPVLHDRPNERRDRLLDGQLKLL